jgi:hypothetical protein
VRRDTIGLVAANTMLRQETGNLENIGVLTGLYREHNGDKGEHVVRCLEGIKPSKRTHSGNLICSPESFSIKVLTYVSCKINQSTWPAKLIYR